MVDHLQDRAFYTLRVEGENTKYDNAKVADTGISQQPFEIDLHQGQHRAVKYAYHRQRIKEWRQRVCRRREELQAETQ